MATLKILIVESKIPAGLLALSDKSDRLIIMNIPDTNRAAANTILAATNADYYNSSEVVTEVSGAVNGIPLPKEAGKRYQ